MDKYIYEKAFKQFLKPILNNNINWALTGSYRLYLESQENFKVNDIDIITDNKGAKIISTIFKKNIVSEFKYSEYNGIYSYFGQLKINNVTFDIMSDVKNKINGKWLNTPSLNNIENLKFEIFNIPVLSLSAEFHLYSLLGQKQKTNQIKEIIKNGLQHRI